jgi:hypothetical protein
MMITFGATAPTIKEQLLAQGLPLPKVHELIGLQKQADAVVVLRVHGTLPEAQADAACRRILRQIGSLVAPEKTRCPAKVRALRSLQP